MSVRIPFFILLLVSLMPMATAQRPDRGPRGGREWWENPLISDLNLSDGQRKQIQATTREFRNRVVDTRATLEKAEGDLQDLFNDGSSDERRVNDAIDRVVKARGEAMKVVTQMSWKIRTALTAEQWQELRRRQGGRGPLFPGMIGPGIGRGIGDARGGPGPRRRPSQPAGQADGPPAPGQPGPPSRP